MVRTILNTFTTPLCSHTNTTQVCNSRLSTLIQLVLGELSPGDRTKIISLITLDVHARDVVRIFIFYIFIFVYYVCR